jgi:hypothetical protein
VVVVVLLDALTMMAPIVMSFVDPWGDISEESNVAYALLQTVTTERKGNIF